MGDENKKSVTIRLDEPDLCDWVASQSSAVASIRMAVKICMLQYGKDMDLLDAILMDKFGTGQTMLGQTSDKNQSMMPPDSNITEPENITAPVNQQANTVNQTVTQSMPTQPVNQQPVMPQQQPQVNQGISPAMQSLL